MSKTLLVMGLPTMVGMLVSALYNIVDAYYVGKLGTLAMAAVSVVNPLSYIGMFVGLLFGCWGNSVIARAFGRGEKEEVKKDWNVWRMAVLNGDCTSGESVVVEQ